MVRLWTTAAAVNQDLVPVPPRCHTWFLKTLLFRRPHPARRSNRPTRVSSTACRMMPFATATTSDPWWTKKITWSWSWLRPRLPVARSSDPCQPTATCRPSFIPMSKTPQVLPYLLTGRTYLYTVCPREKSTVQCSLSHRLQHHIIIILSLDSFLGKLAQVYQCQQYPHPHTYFIRACFTTLFSYLLLLFFDTFDYTNKNPQSQPEYSFTVYIIIMQSQSNQIAVYFLHSYSSVLEALQQAKKLQPLRHAMGRRRILYYIYTKQTNNHITLSKKTSLVPIQQYREKT
jgi:hypothetical protein